MASLDDLRSLSAADPSGVLGVVLGLGAQCRAGYEAGRAAPGLPSGDGLHSLTLCGMGGSGVSGDLVRALYRDRLTFPVDVVKGSELPAHCDKDTLVVCSSYSGNTAETLALFEDAAERGCRTLVVTSGGELSRRAGELDVAAVPAEPGYQPRMALGFLLFGLLGALERMGVVPDLEDEVREAEAVAERLAGELGPDRGSERNEAKAVAARLEGTVPVVWGAEGIGSAAATRWKTDLNENAKVPAFASSLPELDHNEVVGWSEGRGDGFFIVSLRHEGEPEDVAARFPVSVSIAEASGAGHVEVWATGHSPAARLVSLVMKGGVASVYLALLRGVDPAPIAAIDRVKRELAAG